jgi:hypothetical protein
MQGVKLEIPEITVRRLAAEQSDTMAAKSLGIAVSSFFLLRKRYGIPSFTRSTGCRRSLRDGKLLKPGEGIAHPWHSDLYVGCFERIDSPAKAYFLGLLAADGHTSLKPNAKFVSIELQQPDDAVLNELSALLRLNRGAQSLLREGKKPSGRLLIHSRELTESLIRGGITENTETHSLRVHVPPDLRSHCVRGLLDGDGHISARKKSLYLCGCSESIAATVTQWADEQLGIQAACKWRSLPSGKRFFTLTFGGRPRDVLKWAYAPGGPRIPRKEVQADLWLSMYE